MTELPTSDESTRRLKVVRDPTFHRSVADTGLVLDLGRDLEIAFIQFGAEVQHHISVGDEDDEQEGFEMAPGMTEVSRVRISRPSALTMAMMIIEALVEDGRLKEEGFLKSVKAMFDRHREEVAEEK